MSPWPLGIVASSGGGGNPPTSIEYFIVSGGTAAGTFGGRGGYVSNSTLSLSPGQTEIVTVGAGNGNSSLTSVSAPTNYLGSSFSYGLTATVSRSGNTAYAYGGGPGAGGNGLNGYASTFWNGSVYGFQWKGGNGGDGTTFASSVYAKGGGGVGSPGLIAVFDPWGGYYNYFYPQNSSPYGNGAPNTGNGSGGTPGTNGGSGIVIVKYSSDFDDLSSATVSPSIVGSEKLYTFTTSGSFTV